MLKAIDQKKNNSKIKCQFIAMLAALLTVVSIPATGASDPGGYGLKIYKVNSGLYPYVQVYFRTFDQNQQPLVNLNAMNVGLMVGCRNKPL